MCPVVAARSVLVFVCLFCLCCLFYHVKAYCIAVAMTSIPPRFSSLTPTLLSWVEQDIQPCRVYIFLPEQYKRFRKKHLSKGILQSQVESLRTILSKNAVLAKKLSIGWIQLVSMAVDWGPITRVVGALSLSEQCQQDTRRHQRRDHSACDVDYWLIADDDVFYVPHAIHKYQNHIIAHSQQSIAAIHSSEQDYDTTSGMWAVLSQFAPSTRVAIPSRGLSSESLPVELLSHVQAVDTYLFPNPVHQLVRADRPVRCFSYEGLLLILDMLHHDKCPESFYQDDYVMSLLFHLCSLPVISIWDHDNLSKHIEQVSKSHFQMHMSSSVFLKEANTQACLSTYALEVFQELMSRSLSV